MPSPSSESDRQRCRQTLENIENTILQLIEWNKSVSCADDYYNTPSGLQLLAANCTLITAIGEGINRINRILPDFLSTSFPNVPWKAIIGMRNHIALGYFELDADLIYESVKNEIPDLLKTVRRAISLLS